MDPNDTLEPNGASRPDDQFASALRRFGPVGLLAVVIILAGNFITPPLSAILVLVWVHLSQTPWHEIGYVRPRSWAGGLVVGVVFGTAFKLLMKAVVMPLFGAPPINQAYHFLAGNTAALPGMILTIVVLAGFGEETLYRGYLFERLGKLLGSRLVATVVIVLLTSGWFALLHYHDQGAPGVEQAMVTGLAFGTIYAFTRSIWMLMVAHTAFDLTAVAIIYLDREADIAHLFFT